jgi:hypothetical protein
MKMEVLLVAMTIIIGPAVKVNGRAIFSLAYGAVTAAVGAGLFQLDLQCMAYIAYTCGSASIGFSA